MKIYKKFQGKTKNATQGRIFYGLTILEVCFGRAVGHACPTGVRVSFAVFRADMESAPTRYGKCHNSRREQAPALRGALFIVIRVVFRRGGATLLRAGGISPYIFLICHMVLLFVRGYSAGKECYCSFDCVLGVVPWLAVVAVVKFLCKPGYIVL